MKVTKMSENQSEMNNPEQEQNLEHKVLLSGTVRDYNAKMRINREDFNYTWAIANFTKHIYVEDDFDNKLYSQWFEVSFDNHVSSWQIVICPAGASIEYKDYFSIYLTCKTSSREKKVMVNASLLNKSGIEVFAKGYRLDIGNTYCPAVINWFDFARIEDVYERAVFNDELTVKVRISFECGVTFLETENVSFENISSSLNTSLQDDFEKLLESEEFGDADLVVGNKSFKVYKGILAARSKVFRAIFQHDMKEKLENVVTIEDFEPNVMMELLRFVYTGRIKNLDELADSLLAAADKYDLESLKLMCEETLIKKLDLTNFTSLLLLVDRYETSKLYDAVIAFLTIHRKKIAEKEDFGKLVQSLSTKFLTTVTKLIMVEF